MLRCSCNSGAEKKAHFVPDDQVAYEIIVNQCCEAARVDFSLVFLKTLIILHV